MLARGREVGGDRTSACEQRTGEDMNAIGQAGEDPGVGGFAGRQLVVVAVIVGLVFFGLSTGRASTLTTTGVITSNRAVKLCPSGTVVSGLDVDVEPRGYVDLVAPLCRDSSGVVTRGPVIGIPGTVPTGFRRSSCGAAPIVAVGIYGRSGDIVDAIGARCGHPGRPILSAPLRGGHGGGRRGPFDCPIGQRLIGLQGKTESNYYGAPDVSSVTGVCGTSRHP